MDKLNAMRIFAEVSRAGSFTKAAETLGMSAQNVAKSVGALESELKARLLNRSTRSQSLTEIGRVFLERSSRILEEVEDTEALVSHYRTQATGTLRVAVANTFAVYALAEKLPLWLKANPEVSLIVTVIDREVDLVEEGYDLAIRDTAPDDGQVICRRIAPMPIVIAASPEYLRGAPPLDRPEDLERHVLLRRPDQSHWDFLDARGILHRIAAPGRYLASNCQISCAMAAAGLGITKQPLFRVRKLLEAGILVQVLKDYPVPEKTLCAVYPASRMLTFKVRSFLDFLAENFASL